MNANYKVCVLAAGVGTKIGNLSKNVNKAVLPVNFKGVISYIVEKFPKDMEIVIAVGHKKETIIDYLMIAHPERKFTFIEVDKYMGPGTGPGYSLLQCKEALQCPFIFCAADTIVLEEIPEPKENWFGIAPVKDTERYCTVKIQNNLVYQLDDKVKCDNKFAFIGLAGVYDYETFFTALERDKQPISGEIQVSNGFKRLIEKKLVPIGFTWFDTGTERTYAETNKNFTGGEKKFDFSKGDEFIYFVNGRVIKYFADADIVRKRCERAEYLLGLCPEIESSRNNFYAYKKIDGQTLYTILNGQLLADFLSWAKTHILKEQTLSEEERQLFAQACRDFYYTKTLKRVQMFYEKTNIVDEPNVINGISVPTLKSLLDHVDWGYVCAGVPSTFHGDLQFDNVLVTRDQQSQLQKFVLLDWRHGFGSLTRYGDLYYDLAKMYGGIILSYQLIKEGLFSFDMSGSSVYFSYYVKNDLVEAKEIYENFLRRHGYDLEKLKIVTALIFLNMAPLHNDPFDTMLYYLGKNMLHKALVKP